MIQHIRELQELTSSKRNVPSTRFIPLLVAVHHLAAEEGGVERRMSAFRAPASRTRRDISVRAGHTQLDLLRKHE